MFAVRLAVGALLIALLFLAGDSEVSGRKLLAALGILVTLGIAISTPVAVAVRARQEDVPMAQITLLVLCTAIANTALAVVVFLSYLA